MLDSGRHIKVIQSQPNWIKVGQKWVQNYISIIVARPFTEDAHTSAFRVFSALIGLLWPHKKDPKGKMQKKENGILFLR